MPVAALERIAEADAFHALGLDRRQALWDIRGLADDRLPLFAAADEAAEPSGAAAADDRKAARWWRTTAASA